MLPVNSELASVAQRVVWFEPAQQALSNPTRFLAYLMTYGTSEDIEIVEKYASPDDFKHAIEHAPAGIFDPRSWAYWNIKFKHYPVPYLPVRELGQCVNSEINH